MLVTQVLFSGDKPAKASNLHSQWAGVKCMSVTFPQMRKSPSLLTRLRAV